jgi:hypothetical protein
VISVNSAGKEQNLEINMEKVKETKKERKT